MSREALAPMLDAGEEAGCLNLSEFSSAVQDLELLYAMGRELASTDIWPEWSSTSEFRSVREASRE